MQQRAATTMQWTMRDSGPIVIWAVSIIGQQFQLLGN